MRNNVIDLRRLDPIPPVQVDIRLRFHHTVSGGNKSLNYATLQRIP